MAYGQPFMAVWREPYHETLLAFVGLTERRRIDELERWARELRQAFRVNAAFAAPKALDTEQTTLRRALLRRPGSGHGANLTRDEALAMAARAQAKVTDGA